MLSDTSNTFAWPSELKIYLIKDQWQDFQCPTNISAARVMLSYDLFNKSGVIAAGHHLRKMATLIFLYKIHSYPDILEKKYKHKKWQLSRHILWLLFCFSTIENQN